MSGSPSRADNVTPLAGVRPVRVVQTRRYTDPDFAQKELEHLFRDSWQMAGFAWRIPRPGDYFVFDQLGESIIVLRDEQGQVRAFHNTCRHRGAELLRGRGRIRAIQCPYHGWSYGLDGCLTRVPRADGFERLEPNGRGLLTVPVQEWSGMVWIHLGDEPPDFLETLGPLDEELAPYALHEMRPVHAIDEEIPANWKAMLENAMDFYHVPFVHGSTVQKHVQQGPDLATYGDHTRQRLHIAPYGWRERLDRACTRGGPYSAAQISSLHKYLLFPNFLMNVLPYHLTVMQVFPLAPDRCRLRYSFHRRKGARGIELARVLGTWLASRYILWEDKKVLEQFQRGLMAGRNETQPLHDEEAAASWFHGTIDRWLARARR